jgi:metal-responsive CopG/Arc/MetJ family transcriptional regulator
MKKGSPVKVNPQKCKIQIYVTEEVAAELEGMGKKLYRSRPSLINEAILKYIDANKSTTSDIA